MVVKHLKTNKILGSNIKYANTFSSRLIGLMFRKNMNDLDGLILEPGNSVHNCFVRFPIDVIFLTKENEIVKIVRNFKPWRFTRIYFKSRRVLELPAGTVTDDITKGDLLEVSGV